MKIFTASLEPLYVYENVIPCKVFEKVVSAVEGSIASIIIMLFDIVTMYDV